MVLRRSLLAAALAAFGSAAMGQVQLPPAHVTAAGAPIDVQRQGHAAPFVGDFDGDGLADLLVGEFHEGRLRIYPNRGSADEPRFEEYVWFQEGAETGRVPAG